MKFGQFEHMLNNILGHHIQYKLTKTDSACGVVPSGHREFAVLHEDVIAWLLRKHVRQQFQLRDVCRRTVCFIL